MSENCNLKSYSQNFILCKPMLLKKSTLRNDRNVAWIYYLASDSDLSAGFWDPWADPGTPLHPLFTPDPVPLAGPEGTKRSIL